jgi:hypothetical protein
MNDPVRDETTAKWQQSGEMLPDGSICDTSDGVIYDKSDGANEPYPLQGMAAINGRHHIALIQRLGHCAESFDELSPRVSGALGTLALIGLAMLTRPLSDIADDLAALSLSVRS